MENATFISGHSVCLPYAKSSAELIDNLRQGKRVDTKCWFKSDAEAVRCGFNSDKNIARLEQDNEEALAVICRLIDSVLQQAMLDQTVLAGEKVRVYLTGLGPRVDARDYKNYYDRNDVEDIKLTTSVANLQVANLSQDAWSHHLARRYSLKYLPPNLHCTSNLALTAIHLGCQAIEKSGADLVLVINVSQIKTQDIWFLVSQSMLESDRVQPFGENCNRVLPAEGLCVMLLESRMHREGRQLYGGIALKSSYIQISASRSNDAAHLSANPLKVMNRVMNDANVTCNDLGAVIPHGNGSEITDRAEATAISVLLGNALVPVIAYKGQMSYTTTGSGMVDLIIAHHALCFGELISPVANGSIRKEIAPHLLIERGTVKHNKQHILKSGVGVDGSIIGIVVSARNVGRPE